MLLPLLFAGGEPWKLAKLRLNASFEFWGNGGAVVISSGHGIRSDNGECFRERRPFAGVKDARVEAG
jgi:hypothetical protein